MKRDREIEQQKLFFVWRKRLLCSGLCLFLWIILLTPDIYGQQQTVMVSLKVKDVSVLDAIKEINRLCGNDVSFKREELEKEKKLVTLDLKKVTIVVAVEAVLSGTRLVAVMQNDKVLIVPKQDEAVVSIVVKGNVTDKKGEPMPGVTVKLSGTALGTASDGKGNFQLRLPVHRGSLEFSFVGYKTQSKEFNEKSLVIEVVMEEETEALDEVVVTGYQVLKEKGVAGSYSKIKASELVMTGNETLEQMLQGKLPGMMVINTSGLTGTRQKVRVRGTSTLVGNADPVWVVDGIPQQDPLPFETSSLTDISDSNMDMIKDFVGGAISWLNPRDIEDVTVLKDASATAIYGVKAANGVIVITTKKGERGRLSLSYSGSFSASQRLNYNKMEIMNSKERVDFSREGYLRGARIVNEEIGYSSLALALSQNKISYDDFNNGVKRMETENTDWFKILYRTPFSHDHTFSFSGGDDRSTYYASFGYSNNQNTARGNEQETYTGRLNINSTFWKKLTLSASLAGSHANTKAFAAGVDPFNYAIQTSRTVPCYDEKGDLFYYPKYAYNYNILNELAQSGNENTKKQVNLNINLRWIVMEGLTLSTTLGGSSSSSTGRTWFSERSHKITLLRGYEFGAYSPIDKEFKASLLPYGGMLTTTENESFNYTWRGQLEYVKVIGRHAFNVMGGIEANSGEHKGNSQTNYGYQPDRGDSFVDVPLTDLKGTDNDRYARSTPELTKSLANSFSYYAAGGYMYDNRYSLNVSVRGDGSNQFGQDRRARYLPVWSLGARWNVTDEHWLQNQEILNNLSFSATFGYQGNVVEGISPDLVAQISPVDKVTGEYKMKIVKRPTPELNWEKTQTVNLGIAFSIFHSKLNGSFEYYNKKTKDLITQREVPYENGVASMYINGGNMKNSGWDLNFSIVPVRTKDFVWSLGFNTSKVRNEVESNLEPTGQWSDVVSGSFNKKGYPVSSFWAFRFTGLNPKNGGPMLDLTRANSNAADLDVTEYMVHAGKLEPDLTAGLSMSFRYKTLSLSTGFYLSTGNQVFLNSPYREPFSMPSETENASSQLLHRWKKPGDEEHTSIPSIPVGENCRVMYPFKNLTTELYPYDAWRYSDVRVVDAWYLRCNNLTLSYTFPEKMVSGFAKNLSCSFTVSNPFQIVSSDFDGRDPEVAKGSQPLSRNFSFSLNMSF